MMIILMFICVFVWFWFFKNDRCVDIINNIVGYESDREDKNCINGIYSYNDGLNCSNKTVNHLNKLLYLYHDEILNEIMNVEGYNMSTNFEEEWINKENKWNPVWIRFLNNNTHFAKSIPTLNKILKYFPEIPMIYISIFHPGMIIIEDETKDRGIYKYRYCLKADDRDIGLKIKGFDVKWKEKQGIIWNPNIMHSVWNHTTKTRIMICADIFKDLTIINNLFTKKIYYLNRPVKNMLKTVQQLEYEGMIKILEDKNIRRG